MSGFKKYYQKTWNERLQVLEEKHLLNVNEITYLRELVSANSLGDTVIENFITEYSLPEGLGLNYLIDGQEYVIPMVTEEPSVVAASCHGAKIIKAAGGFKTKLVERLMIGQVLLENVVEAEKLIAKLEDYTAQMLKVANDAHPSILKRGGGARWIRLRILDHDLISVDLAVDVKQAMGANMLNTMLEAVANFIQRKFNQDILMSILSNYATSCLATAQCEIPVDKLAKEDISGLQVAKKIAQASRVAQLDVYRAATHNKGIMNGVDAVVLASGNDWRAIEAGIHAYAARDGQYRGLSNWKVEADKLIGEMTLPLPLGFVGGSIGIVPLVKINHKLLQINNAEHLERIVVCVGLAQNLAALNALVTEGIQKGHMHLQMKSLAVTVGAKSTEINMLVNLLEKDKVRDSANAKKLLEQLRKKEN